MEWKFCQNASFANLIILSSFGPEYWKQQAVKVNMGANQSCCDHREIFHCETQICDTLLILGNVLQISAATI